MGSGSAAREVGRREYSGMIEVANHRMWSVAWRIESVRESEGGRKLGGVGECKWSDRERGERVRYRGALVLLRGGRMCTERGGLVRKTLFRPHGHRGYWVS